MENLGDNTGKYEGASLKTYADSYVTRYAAYSKERDRLDEVIERHRRAITFNEKKRAKLDETRPYWINGIIRPIGEFLARRLPDYDMEILGPFGIGAKVAIHMPKKGADKQKDYDGYFNDMLSITFRPRELAEGEIVIVDYSQNTGEYAKGTVGEVNGFNHPEIPMIWDEEEFFAYFLKLNEKHLNAGA
jgi:hypothetical protein